MTNQVNEIRKSLIKQFEDLNGAKFVGIKAYNSKTTGEIANHVLLANFSYSNAVNKDLASLQAATQKDVMNINEKYGFPIDLINTAINKLTASFIKNQDKETASNQSLAQSDAFYHITNSIKIHKETLKVHIFALHVNKTVIVEGVKKTTNSRELTKCQNAVKKYFNFTTSKYRTFIVDKNYLANEVNISGESYSLK